MSGKTLSRRGLAALLLAALLALVPGGAKVAAADQQVLKFALLIPRTPELAMEEKKYNKRLAELTDNQVQVRVYWGGAAGDEQDVVRKMRSGQIDGSPLGLDVLSQFVRECLVLQTPGLFRNYKQVDTVRNALSPAFSDEAYKNGYKALVWGDIGRLRIFSKKKLNHLGDFKTVRPWLYPASTMLKDFYKQIGATGVPLGLAEVYGGMQTGMIDTYWATSVLAIALQWHRTSKFVSGDALGFINGAVVVRRPAWDALPEAGKKGMTDIIAERAAEGQQKIRVEDDKVYQRLLERGHKAMRPDEPGEWWAAGKALRRHLIGRVYTKALVEKAEQLALKDADAEQIKYFNK
jgi:TRAP-type C4-dicarboxylate transport system substrate-binding protein